MATATSTGLQNIYYERKTGTSRPCFICNRPTTTVLATIKTEDFLYTCDSHLTDTASPISSPTPIPALTPTSGPSAEDLKKVISEYQSREARKLDKDKVKKDEKDTDKDKEKENENDKINSSTSIPSTQSIPTSTVQPPIPAPTHKKYALHRHIFEMRKNELKRKEQGNKAKEVSRGELISFKLN
uniref:DUF1742-domain-containing protein n=1 Tax=Kwoniella pini CBS 10737 TaxID=1296096 RepID=A0A1B9I901_9TREE|nr:uncharacterized protein I206_01284 [Kwoniella pini CBS 10737]OCF52000.1 hypothetical protein I206_01284 [Kwoniella pini CBS 10737]